MATKDCRRHARGLIEGLESRIHLGPPILETEIHMAREFLRQNAFSPASDYFNRLGLLQDRLAARVSEPCLLPAKRNYGGEGGGYWLQLQSAYDHVILSTCYEGEFNLRRGRVKVSHRFNQAGRIDFVEVKFLRSLQPYLNGEIRKLMRVKDYQAIRKDWHSAEAFVLPVLPRELVFLHQDLFRCPRTEVLAWLINIGHRIGAALCRDLSSRRINGCEPPLRGNGDQLCLEALPADEVAWPVLQTLSGLEAAVELSDPQTAIVRYIHLTSGAETD